MFGLTQKETRQLRALNTPRKIQNFINDLPPNYEPNGITCRSPRKALLYGKVHCLEAALLAALAFRLHGQEPLIVDLTTTKNDLDHVIAVFREHRSWGAVSKSNHAVLRYREPIYRTIRELVLSFFHEYVDDNGHKSLRSYTKPINLSRFDAQDWITSREDVWYIPEYLVSARHIPLLSKSQVKTLRRADAIECQAGQLTEWKK